MNRVRTLVKRVKLDKGWRFCTIARDADGALKPDTIIIDGDEVINTSGHFAIRYFEGSALRYERIEGGVEEALEAIAEAQKPRKQVADPIVMQRIVALERRLTELEATVGSRSVAADALPDPVHVDHAVKAGSSSSPSKSSTKTPRLRKGYAHTLLQLLDKK